MNADLMEVPPDQLVKRQHSCMGCIAVDSLGRPLFRSSDSLNGATCGAPKVGGEIRDEAKEGCGCNLAEKWKYVNEHCPLANPRW